MHPLHTSFGSYTLRRQPLVDNDLLQAWDAADELMLATLANSGDFDQTSNVLIVNDSFGALCCALHRYDITVYSDSYLTQKSIEHNFQHNRLGDSPTFVPSTSSLTGYFDTVAIKIPKSLALLEHQLILLQRVIDVKTRIIAGGMVKYLQKSHFRLFEKYIGPVTTSLAKKKARLLYASYNGQRTDHSPYPADFVDPVTGLTLSNHANVFSREKLDIGSRFLLQHLQRLPSVNSIIDIGCGNGILGIAARIHLGQRNSGQSNQSPMSVLFADESFMALESSKMNYQRAFVTHEGAGFFASDCFDEIPAQEVELILCNPPFHQANTVGDHIAWKMIAGSRNFLARGGMIWLVGNRHLNYHQKLKKLFGNCQLIASNQQFVLLAATRN